MSDGGREHARTWKLSQSIMVQKVDLISGNGGAAHVLGNVSNVSEVKPDDLSVLVALSSKRNTSLAVPGPEAPSVAGIGEPFSMVGIARTPRHM